MKWSGVVGYAIENETKSGVWSGMTERKYYGDVTRNSRRIQSSNKVNDDVTVSNEISIVADPYAYENFHAIRYVEFMGTFWTVDNAEVEYPRIKMTIGGIWNGETASRTS